MIHVSAGSLHGLHAALEATLDVDLTLHLAANRLLMSAFLYYRCASPVLSDGDYDALSVFVAARWRFLSPERQWALGSAEDVFATGSHFKITLLCMEGALLWHAAEKDFSPEILGGAPMLRMEPGDFCRWFPAEG